MTSSGPLLLYDGVCALCNGAVRFILKRDAARSVRFAPLDGATARPVLDAHPELHGVDSMIFVDARGRALTRSSAVVAVLRQLQGAWALLGSVLAVVPAPIRNFAYDLVARRRYRVFGRYDACPVPRADQQSRFLP